MSFQRGGGMTELWKSETFSWNSSPSSLLTLPSSFIWVEEARKEGGGRQTRYITSEPVHVWSNNKWKGGKHAGWCLRHCASSSQAANPKDSAFIQLHHSISKFTFTQLHRQKKLPFVHLIFYLSNFQRQVSIANSYFSLPKLTFPLGSRVAEY